MQSQQLAKIKNLINTSQILDQTEREEWLTLLPLMNDKQLLELQRILTSPVAAEAPAPRFAPPAVSSGQVSKVSKTLPLKHIMNLPAWEKPGLAPAEIAKTQAGIKKSGFLSKLKSILKEKELPEGHPEFELELPALPLTASQGRPVPGAETGKKFDDNQKIKKVPPAGKPESVKQILAQRPLKKERPAPKVPLPQKSTGFLADKTKPVGLAPAQNIMTKNLNLTLGKGSSALIYSSKGVDKLEHKEAKQALSVLNLKDAGMPKKDVAVSQTGEIAKTRQVEFEDKNQPRKVEWEAVFPAQKIADMPLEPEAHKGIDKWPQLESVVSRPTTGASQVALDLDTLDQLSEFNIAQFEGGSLEDLVVKIKKLVKMFGYHNVVFNLEKSPLFKAYINTGMQLLNERADKVGQAVIKDNFLNKREFEKFVDLLRQIQAV